MTRFILFVLIVSVVALSAAPVLAADEGEFTYERLVNTAYELVKIALRIAGLIGVIMITFNGVKMVMSKGDASKLAEAKKGLMYAAGGLVVIFGVWTIIATLQKAVQSVGN